MEPARMRLESDFRGIFAILWAVTGEAQQKVATCLVAGLGLLCVPIYFDAF
jgi:hypothetical protein